MHHSRRCGQPRHHGGHDDCRWYSAGQRGVTWPFTPWDAQHEPAVRAPQSSPAAHSGAPTPWEVPHERQKAASGRSARLSRADHHQQRRCALGVRDFGSRRDADRTIVLLHGLGLSQDSWTSQIRRLITRWGSSIRIVSFDHRGHGSSTPAPKHTYQIERLGADLAEVLTALGITGPVTIAGHSMGGMAALAYLARPFSEQPIQADGLVLIATAAGKLAERGLGRLLATPATALLCELVNLPPHAATDHLIQALARPAPRAQRIRRAQPRPPQSPDRHRRHLPDCHTTDHSRRFPARPAALQRLRCAAHHHRTHDRRQRRRHILTPTAHALDLVAGIDYATHLHLPGGGHMLLQEAPHLVGAALERAMCGPAAHTRRASPPRPTRPRVLEAI